MDGGDEGSCGSGGGTMDLLRQLGWLWSQPNPPLLWQARSDGGGGVDQSTSYPTTCQTSGCGGGDGRST